MFIEEECYHCLASLVAAKEKVFITQTKLLHEVTWKTVMQIAKKHAVSVGRKLAPNETNNTPSIYTCYI